MNFTMATKERIGSLLRMTHFYSFCQEAYSFVQTHTHTLFRCITLKKANLFLHTTIVAIVFGSYKNVSTRWRRLPLCKGPEAAQLMITKYPHHGPRPARSRRGVTKLSGVPLYGPAEKWLTCTRWGGWSMLGYTQAEESDEWAGVSRRV